ncbi:3'-5' exonuclease [bacterium]|nr:3'-5' exonuclease [bacterium]
MNYAVIDIETRIDKALVKEVYESGSSISDDEAYENARQRILEESSGRTDFFPVPFHIPVSIVIGQVNETMEMTNITVLGEEQRDFSPRTLTTLFWERLERFKGALVSFNGRGFDLPVLELQALKYGLSLRRYFDPLSGCRHRYSDSGHFDLMDFLTNYGAFFIKGGLNVLCKMVGLPGKEKVKGGDVQGLWEKGSFDQIHRYCRKDVIQTYFLFLRVELLRGKIDQVIYETSFKKSQPFMDELMTGY